MSKYFKAGVCTLAVLSVYVVFLIVLHVFR